MAKVRGNDGRIKIGANVVAEIEGFEVSDSARMMTGAAVTDTVEQNAAGVRVISGSIKAFWDRTDTNGQVAMQTGLTGGSDVTLLLFPDGATTASEKITVVGKITEIKKSVQQGEYVRAEFSFVGNTITYGTAP